MREKLTDRLVRVSDRESINSLQPGNVVEIERTDLYSDRRRDYRIVSENNVGLISLVSPSYHFEGQIDHVTTSIDYLSIGKNGTIALAPCPFEQKEHIKPKEENYALFHDCLFKLGMVDEKGVKTNL